MKRFLLIGLVVLTAAACKKVTPEEQIAAIDTYFSQYDNSYIARLGQLTNEEKTDYLTYILLQDLNAREAWILEEGTDLESLVAEFPGKKEEEGQISSISVSLGDPVACAAALGVFNAYKDLKIKPNTTLRVLFYAPASDSSGRSGLNAFRDDCYEAGESVSMDIHLSSIDSLAPRTFFLEDNPRYVEQFLQVIPPYFEPLGDYAFQKGTYPNPEWPLKASTIRYNLDSGRLSKETAAITTLCYLLN